MVVTYCVVMLSLSDLPAQVTAKAKEYAERGVAELHYARKMFEAGALRLEPPQHMLALVADIGPGARSA